MQQSDHSGHTLGKLAWSYGHQTGHQKTYPEFDGHGKKKTLGFLQTVGVACQEEKTNQSFFELDEMRGYEGSEKAE